MLSQSSPAPRGSSTPDRTQTALANPTNPGSASRNSPNSTQKRPAFVFFQPAAASCSGDFVESVPELVRPVGRGAGGFDGRGSGGAARDGSSNGLWPVPKGEGAGGAGGGTGGWYGLGASAAPQSSGLATGAGEPGGPPGRGVEGVVTPPGFEGRAAPAGVSGGGVADAPAPSSPAGT